MISDTRLPLAFCAFISGGRRESGDEVSSCMQNASSYMPSTPCTEASQVLWELQNMCII